MEYEEERREMNDHQVMEWIHWDEMMIPFHHEIYSLLLLMMIHYELDQEEMMSLSFDYPMEIQYHLSLLLIR